VVGVDVGVALASVELVVLDLLPFLLDEAVVLDGLVLLLLSEDDDALLLVVLLGDAGARTDDEDQVGCVGER
jgi:hypothetical protein